MQFGLAAIAPEDADRGDLVGLGGVDVVQAVANHDRGGGAEALDAQDFGQQVLLVVQTAAGQRAVDPRHVTAEFEVVDDAFGEVATLGCGEAQGMAGIP